MTEEEKVIIAKICRNEKPSKKYSNDVLEQNTEGVIHYLLMNKAVIQNPLETTFFLTTFFIIAELITETKS